MSKTETLNKWLAIAQYLAPVVLATVPGGEKIAPFVPLVSAGIQEAEQIPNASGPEKKAHVIDLAMAAFQTLQATGKLHMDAAQFQSTVGAGVDATVGVVNLVHQAHQAVPAGVLLAPQASTTGE